MISERFRDQCVQTLRANGYRAATHDGILSALLPVMETECQRRVSEELETVRRWIVQSGNASGPVLRYLRSRAAAAGRLGPRS